MEYDHAGRNSEHDKTEVCKVLNELMPNKVKVKPEKQSSSQ